MLYTPIHQWSFPHDVQNGVKKSPALNCAGDFRLFFRLAPIYVFAALDSVIRPRLIFVYQPIAADFLRRFKTASPGHFPRRLMGFPVPRGVFLDGNHSQNTS
jgi:hypothetical protein